MTEPLIETEVDLHTRLLDEAQLSGATIEDFARAWASIDGKRDQFDAGKGRSLSEDGNDGHYAGYLAEAEEMFRRAASYARERELKGNAV